MNGIVLQYKGFYGFARFYPEDGYYHGTLENVQAHATFGGETPEETLQDFHELVDDYLESAPADETSHPDKKLVIDMTEYPFGDDQPVLLKMAEG
jgi:predicted HicB family RNase H-like nuclease